MIFGKEVSGPEVGIPIRVWSEILSADAARRAELIAHFISKNAKKICLRRCFGIDPGSGTLKSRYGGVGGRCGPGHASITYSSGCRLSVRAFDSERPSGSSVPCELVLGICGPNQGPP